MENMQFLQKISSEIGQDILEYEYVRACRKIRELRQYLTEIHLEEDEQIFAAAILKTLEDIEKSLEKDDTDSAVLYSLVHLSQLVALFEKKEEQIELLLEALREARSEIERLSGIEKQIQSLVTPEKFCEKYEMSEDEEIQEIVAYVKEKDMFSVYNYEYKEKYWNCEPEIYFDEAAGMPYIMYCGKRMYFPASFVEDRIKSYISNVLSEQDEKSPHYYNKEGYQVEEGDVVIDAGVAEGNFALSVIDKVKKIYLIECDDLWIPVLKKTFEPYKEKVVLVEKFLGNQVDEKNITIDALLDGEPVNYIKMDIEGAEREALLGGRKSIEGAKEQLKMAVCAYHRHGDENWITDYMKAVGMEAECGKGYMYFAHDVEALLSMELRRGLVFGRK